MFDAYTFVRKNAKSLTTPVVAYGFKMKLNGWADDSVESLGKLAEQQLEDVRVSLPKQRINDEVERGAKSAVLGCKDVATLIRGGEEEETKETKGTKGRKERGGIDPAVQHVNGQV